MFYDAFLFNNECDTLELRLSELEGVVDRFLLVESERTHSGMPKPLHFAANRERFARWSDKIIHRVVNLPQRDNDGRENAHRRALGDCLREIGMQSTDIVHTSDLDEVPAEAAIKRWTPDMGIHAIECPHSYYWMNCENGGWAAGRIGTWEQIQSEVDGDFQRLRHFPRNLPCLRTDPTSHLSGGWHFSFMGGVQAIQNKLAAYLHSDAARPDVLDPKYLQFCISCGVNLFGMITPTHWDNFLEFTTPRVMPKAIEKFPYLWAKGVRFHEYWTNPTHLMKVWRAARTVDDLQGSVVEIGSWEGISTLAIAAAVYPNKVNAVGAWQGNKEEGENHATCCIARERDVFKQFCTNTSTLGQGNVVPIEADYDRFWKIWDAPIKFAYIKGAHTYDAVKRDITEAQRHMVKGGIICGDDYQSASKQHPDLNGGVEKAVDECLKGVECFDNFYCWINR